MSLFMKTELFANQEEIHSVEITENSPTYEHTVWKVHNFSVTQILREIKVGDFRVSEFAL